MLESEPLLDPRALSRISDLEWIAKIVVEGTISGSHRSPRQGFSTDFLQHRPYVPGDDLRRLDWRVFGKTDRHYLRQFEDDTNVAATILVDASGSMAYGSGVSKMHYAVRLAASLAFLFHRQHDAVGLLVFDSESRTYLPARTGRVQLKRVFESLASVESGGETALGSVLRDLSPRLRRRGLLILLTDAFDEAEPLLLQGLTPFRQAGYEVTLFQLLDRDEVEFPFNRWTRFEGLEDARRGMLVDPAQFRRSYLARFAAFRKTLQEGCRDLRIDFVSTTTDQPYDEALAAYLHRRRRPS